MARSARRYCARDGGTNYGVFARDASDTPALFAAMLRLLFLCLRLLPFVEFEPPRCRRHAVVAAMLFAATRCCSPRGRAVIIRRLSSYCRLLLMPETAAKP